MSTSTLRPSAAPLAALGAATEPESRRERRRRERLEEQESTIPVELYGLRRGTVTLLTVLAFLFAIFTLVPIAWILINSTKTQANIFETFGFWFARPFSFFHNFSLLFQNVDGYGTYIQWFGNTALYAVLGGVGATALSAFAGYGFARFSFRGSKLLFYLTIAALLVPITALTLPLYLTYAKAHLINSLWGMVLPSMISPVGIYLMRVYVDISVPRELIDAARLDGAGEARIFFRVALPLMVPGFMTVLLISVVAVWNNYFLPLLIFNINTRYPLTVGLGLWSERAQNSGNAQLFPMVVIGGLVTIIPLIALFLILQRYWRGGLLLGSIANLFRRPCRGGDFPQRIDQGLRDRRGRAGRAGPGRRRRRVRRAGRPFRLRQDDGPADGRGARADHVGDDQLRRPRGQRRVAPAPRRRHGLPELCALPAPFCVPEHRLRAGEQEDREGRTGPADPRCRRDSRPGGPARAQAEAVVRRPAAAGGDGPGDRAFACRVPHGRAAVQPGRQAPGADALGGTAGAPVDSGRDVVRHPRPDRGDDDGRPGGGAAGRRPAAVRHAAVALRAAGQRLRGRVHRLPRDEPVRGGPGSWTCAHGGARLAAAGPARPGRRPRRRLPGPQGARRGAPGRSRGVGGAPGLVADVRLVEVLGSEQHVHFQLDATPAVRATGGAAALADESAAAGILAASAPNGMARIDPRAGVRSGGRVTFAVDPARLYFFDPDTGRAITDPSLLAVARRADDILGRLGAGTAGIGRLVQDQIRLEVDRDPVREEQEAFLDVDDVGAGPPVRVIADAAHPQRDPE